MDLKESDILLALENAIWRRVEPYNRPTIQLIDCSMEILKIAAQQVEQACSVQVIPYLLDQVKVQPSQLVDSRMIVTTVMHYGELRELYPDIPLEKVAMRVSASSVDRLVHLPTHTKEIGRAHV